MGERSHDTVMTEEIKRFGDGTTLGEMVDETGRSGGGAYLKGGMGRIRLIKDKKWKK